jgi:8-oxo-dGTP pyrophosphatase MutT (NUDIX family)
VSHATLPPAAESMTLLVGAVIIHDAATQRVLLIQRGPRAKFGAGCWDLPIGKTAPGEAVTMTAVRELKEETGLIVDPDDLQVAHVIHGSEGVEAPAGFLTVVFAPRRWSGEPVNREPEKHSAVGWVDVAELSGMVFVPDRLEALTGYFTGGSTVTCSGW